MVDYGNKTARHMLQVAEKKVCAKFYRYSRFQVTEAEESELTYPLEQIMYRWACVNRPNQHISIVFPEPCLEETIVFVKYQENSVIEICEMSWKEFKNYYGVFPRMPETVCKYSDQSGYVPDLEWFEDRNKKLSIGWDEKWDAHLLPARSLAPLVLSYLSSTRGIVKVNPAIEKYDGSFPRYSYQLKCIFLGDDEEEVGWEESVVIPQPRLQRFLKSHGVSILDRNVL